MYLNLLFEASPVHLKRHFCWWRLFLMKVYLTYVIGPSTCLPKPQFLHYWNATTGRLSEWESWKEQQYVNVAAVSCALWETKHGSCQWERFAISIAILLFPNALCAISLITECVGCYSCYSFIQTFFVLSSYQRKLASAFVGLPYNYFSVTFS